MARQKKPRKKSYRPKSVSGIHPLLMQLPIHDEDAKSLVDEARSHLISMRMGPKRGSPLIQLIIELGIFWILAEKTEECAEIRTFIESALNAVRKDIPIPGPLSDQAFECTADALETGLSVLRCSTQAEFNRTRDFLLGENSFALVDDLIREAVRVFGTDECDPASEARPSAAGDGTAD